MVVVLVLVADKSQLAVLMVGLVVALRVLHLVQLEAHHE
jgi:hypothetical protein